MHDAPILCLGEALWDELPGNRRLGGAPLNVCWHARQCGLDAIPLSAVGRDPAGEELLGILREQAVPTAQIARTTQPTGRVQVAFNEQGQPQYTICEQVAWDHIPVSESSLQLARRAAACCFGSLAQRSPVSRNSIRALLQAMPETAWKVFDVNLRPPFVEAAVVHTGLQAANVAKISDEEMPEVCRLLDLPGDLEAAIEALLDRFELQLLALTLGSEGSLHCRPGRPVVHAPATALEAKRDSVGAGDSFTACLIYGLLQGWDDERCGRLANRVASFVCSQDGATPHWPADLKAGL